MIWGFRAYNLARSGLRVSKIEVIWFGHIGFESGVFVGCNGFRKFGVSGSEFLQSFGIELRTPRKNGNSHLRFRA